MSTNVHENILGAIGNTPMVRLNHVTRALKATVYAKVETFNPGNSIKDRMALGMIEYAEHHGLLKPGQTVVVHAAAGGVGQLLCQWARHLGATVIGAVGRRD